MSDDQTLDLQPQPEDPNTPRPIGAPADRTPNRIGRYHIKSLIASGGMGAVYKAVQERPRRTVALKLMKRGIASRSALRRFEYESQLLARLRHPHIAEVYDAGTHNEGDGGTPYFVMEYIPGARRITDYAREKNLGTRQKLELFLHVADAVHHGHTKGIIHRDLKPDNILVDSHGRVKIIDFGVARATDSDLAVTTLQTDIGQLIGTVQYMSPEQVEADPTDLDTRSDVYSLGVVLYELLTGKLPYDVKGVKVYEATRLIREQEAAKLSTIDSGLRGDIETIVLTAMAKDREHRYQSARGIRNDIEHYLRAEPITARPPSMSYQLRMFARRNKPLVTGIAAVFVALLLGVVGMAALWRQAESSRRDAETARSDAEAARKSEAEQRQLAEQREADAHAAEQRAEAEAVRARQERAAALAVNDFLFEDIIAYADPSVEPDRDITLRDVLDRAAARVGERFADVPLVEASVQHTVGETYHGLGEYDAAARYLQRAVDIRTEHLGDADPLTLDSVQALASAWLSTAGRRDDAQQALRTTLERRREVLGPRHRDTLWTEAALAGAEGDLDALERVAEAQSETLGPGHPDTLASRVALASSLVLSRESRDRAIEILRAATRLAAQSLPSGHPVSLRAQSQLGSVLNESGRYDQAIEVLDPLLEQQTRVLGPEHRDTLITAFFLAASHLRAGHFEQATRIAAPALSRAEQRFGREAFLPTQVLTDTLADAYLGQGEFDRGLEMYQRLYDTRLGSLGPQHQGTAWAHGQLVRIHLATGNHDAAYELVRDAPVTTPASIHLIQATVAAFLADAARYDQASKELHRLVSTVDSQTVSTHGASAMIALLLEPLDAQSEPGRWAIGAARQLSDAQDDATSMRALARGLAEVRDGRFDAAAEPLRRAARSQIAPTRGAALAYHAIAEWRRGNADAARNLLAEAAAAVDPMAEVTYHVNSRQWVDLLWARTALNEARALIHASPGEPPSTDPAPR